MARACKCKICGKTISTDTAYKRVVSGKNWYACSEDEYNTWQAAKAQEQAERDRVYEAICAILGYKCQNSVLWREWSKWSELKPNKMIAEYLEENKDYLMATIGRLSGSEFGRIRYLSTVLCNSLKDFKPKEEPKFEIKISTEEHYETKYKPKERVGLLDLEDEYDE